MASTNNVYTLKKMLRLKDIKEFVTAIIQEISDHEDRDYWVLMKRADVQKGAKIISSVWQFKINRLSDGTITKHEARLNAHGDWE